MTFTAAVVVGSLACLLAQPAAATQTWCATVKADVADGYLNLRGAPSASAVILFRLMPGEYVEIDTAQCAEQLDAHRSVLGTVCAPVGSNWSFVEHVPSMGGGGRVEQGGWINARFVDQVACRSE